MRIEVLPDENSVAEAAAVLIAERARAAIELRGRFVLALSGGRTPWIMLRALARKELPWSDIHIVQVDERIAPEGDATRNITYICENLIALVPLPTENLHAMPVESVALCAAAESYANILSEIAGVPAVIDLIHLGLGADGHIASLVPGEPAMDINNTDVALTGYYQGQRRMTLTFPLINRARYILFVVTGAEKAAILARLRAGDRSIPAGRVNIARAMVLADHAAMADRLLTPIQSLK